MGTIPQITQIAHNDILVKEIKSAHDHLRYRYDNSNNEKMQKNKLSHPFSSTMKGVELVDRSKGRFPKLSGNLPISSPISSPESFCARLKKRKTLGRSVEERTLIAFYENNTNDRKSFRTEQNGGESLSKVSASVQVLQL